MSRVPTQWKQIIANGFLYGAFVGFLFLATLIFLDRVQGLHVDHVVIEGAYYVPGDDIHTVVVADITGTTCLRIVSCDNVLFFPKKSITRHLLRQFPRLDSVSTAIQGTTIVVSVTERSHVAVACVPDKTACWFIDDAGIAFAPSPIFSDGVYITFSIPISLTTLPTRVLPAYMYSGISKFNNQIQSEISSVSFDERSVQLMIRQTQNSVFAQPVSLYIQRDAITSEKSIDYIAHVFSRLWDSEKMRSAIESGKQLNYIDLRFDGKVFYKFL